MSKPIAYTVELRNGGNVVGSVRMDVGCADVIVGRSHESTLRTPADDHSISGRHMRIFWRGKTLYVEDAAFFVIQGTGLATAEGKAYLWWLNNTNNGSQVVPTYAVTAADGKSTFIWNIAESGLGASFQGGKTYLIGTAAWNTTFGLTLADDNVPAVISYIGFEKNGSQIVEDAKIATGINSTKQESRDGDIIYNLRGQRMQTLGKGIYIINGKKVIK